MRRSLGCSASLAGLLSRRDIKYQPRVAVSARRTGNRATAAHPIPAAGASDPGRSRYGPTCALPPPNLPPPASEPPLVSSGSAAADDARRMASPNRAPRIVSGSVTASLVASDRDVKEKREGAGEPLSRRCAHPRRPGEGL